jgi:Rieske Fe-S protein
VLAACTDGDGSSIVQTGSLNGPDGENPGTGSGPGSARTDAGVQLDAPATHDSGTGATCPTSGVTDTGHAPSAVTTNKPLYVSSGNFFLMRDSGGLYALTARCTHQGVTISAETSDFFCTAHGATFDFNGNVTGGPTSTNLVHYALCLLGSGNVGVIKSQTVAQSQRLVA